MQLSLSPMDKHLMLLMLLHKHLILLHKHLTLLHKHLILLHKHLTLLMLLHKQLLKPMLMRLLPLRSRATSLNLFQTWLRSSSPRYYLFCVVEPGMATNTFLALHLGLVVQAQHAIHIALHIELLCIDSSSICLGHDRSG